MASGRVRKPAAEPCGADNSSTLQSRTPSTRKYDFDADGVPQSS